MNNNDFANKLSLILQALSLELLFQDCNNNDLMQELQRQDKEFLEKIIKQNEEIINLLKKGEQNGR
jgi:hypothetical protein